MCTGRVQHKRFGSRNPPTPRGTTEPSPMPRLPFSLDGLLHPHAHTHQPNQSTRQTCAPHTLQPPVNPPALPTLVVALGVVVASVLLFLL